MKFSDKEHLDSKTSGKHDKKIHFGIRAMSAMPQTKHIVKER